MGTWRRIAYSDTAQTLSGTQTIDETTNHGLVISSLANYKGIELNALGAARPAIYFKNANQGTLGSIYGTEGNDLELYSTGDIIINSENLTLSLSSQNEGILIKNTHYNSVIDFHRASTATARIQVHEPGAVHTSALKFYTSDADSSAPNLQVAMMIGSDRKVSLYNGLYIDSGDAVFADDVRVKADSKALSVGASNDIQIYHNGSHSYFENANVGNMYFQQSVAGAHHIFQTITSGSLTTRFEVTDVGISTEGNATFAGSIKGNSTNFDIYQTSSDASDNRRTRIGGGGDVSQSRGAYIELAGNEHSNTGQLILNAGDVTGGDILFKTDNTTRLTIDDTNGKATFSANVQATQLILKNSSNHILLHDTDEGDTADFFRLEKDGGAFRIDFYDNSAGSNTNNLFTVSNTGNATFAGNISVGDTGYITGGVSTQDRIGFSAGSLDLKARGNATIDIDSNNADTSRTFKITHNGGTQLLSIDESGHTTIAGNIKSSGGWFQAVYNNGYELAPPHGGYARIQTDSGNSTQARMIFNIKSSDGSEVTPFSMIQNGYIGLGSDITNNVTMAGAALKIISGAATFSGNATAVNFIGTTAVYSNSGVYYGSSTTLYLKDSGGNEYGHWDANKKFTNVGDIQAPGIYVGSTNTSYDFYNNGTTYLNGATTIDADTSITGQAHLVATSGNSWTALKTSGAVEMLTSSADSSEKRFSFAMGGASDSGTLSLYNGDGTTVGTSISGGDANAYFSSTSGKRLHVGTIEGNAGIESTNTSNSSDHLRLKGYTLKIGKSATDLVLDSSGNATFGAKVGIGVDATSDFEIKMATDKHMHFSDSQGETGNCPTIHAVNTAGSANVDLGFRGSNLIFATGSAERMRTTDTGLGIGVTPSYKLDVAGTTRVGTTSAGGTLRLEGKAGVSYPWQLETGTTGGLTFDSNTTDVLTLKDDGRVGVGILAPQTHLDVRSYQADGITIGADNDANRTRTDSTTKSGGITGVHYDNDEESIRIIGYSSTSSANQIYIGGANSDWNAATEIKLYTAANATTVTGTARLAIESDGDIVINGRIKMNTSGQFYWGDAHNQGYLNWTTNKVIMGGLGSNALDIVTNNTTALAIDTSQDATFSGHVSVNDTKRVGAGDDTDIWMTHSTHSYIENKTGEMRIVQGSGDHFSIWLDNGSGTDVKQLAIAPTGKVHIGNGDGVGQLNVKNNTGDLLKHIVIDTGTTQQDWSIGYEEVSNRINLVIQKEYGNGSFSNALKIMNNGGQVQGANGSLSAPTYSFWNDTDTGLFLTEVGGIGISVAGSQALSFNSSLTASFGGDVYIPANLVHSGDGNNYIGFQTDRQDFVTDGVTALTIDSSQSAIFYGTIVRSATNNSAGTAWTAIGDGNIPHISIRNLSTTDDTMAGLFFRDDQAHRAGIHAKFTSHTDSSEYAELIFSTTTSGNTRERMTIGGDGDVSIVGSTNYSQLRIKGAGDESGIKFIDSGGNTDGFIYANANNIGFLASNGNWKVKHEDNGSYFSNSIYVPWEIVHTGDTDTRITFDTNNVSLRAGDTIPVSANHSNVIMTAGSGVSMKLDLISDNGANHADNWRLSAETDHVFEIQSKDGGSFAPVIELSGSDKKTYLKGGLNIVDDVTIQKVGDAKLYLDANYGSGDSILYFKNTADNDNLWSAKRTSDGEFQIEKDGADALVFDTSKNVTVKEDLSVEGAFPFMIHASADWKGASTEKNMPLRPDGAANATVSTGSDLDQQMTWIAPFNTTLRSLYVTPETACSGCQFKVEVATNYAVYVNGTSTTTTTYTKNLTTAGSTNIACGLSISKGNAIRLSIDPNSTAVDQFLVTLVFE